MVRQSGAVRSATGCLLHTTLYRPSRPRTDGLVVLAPGFLRSRSHMRDLAQALAADGIPAVTLDPCNSRPWGGRQIATAADMVQIARTLDARRVVYAGFSAGALSALIAARLDPRAVGVLALDLVDNRGLGLGMAKGLDRPLVGLRGEPARCNARGNGAAVFAAAPRAQLTAIPRASHCDFESPTDRLCEVLCPALGPGAERRRAEILRLSAEAVRGLLLSAPGIGDSRS